MYRRFSNLSRITIGLFCLFSSIVAAGGTSAESANQKLSGIWVAEGSRFSSTIRPVQDQEFGFSYLHYIFLEDRMCFGYNAFETTGCYNSVEYTGDTIRIFGRPAFHFQFPERNTMILTRLGPEARPTRLFRQDEFRVADDPSALHKPTQTVHPIHLGSFAEQFFFNSLVIYPAPKNDQIIRVEFTVNAQGFVSDPVILSPHSRTRRRWFTNTLLGTSQTWLPATINGRPVASRIQLNVVRVGYRTLEAQERAQRHYAYAMTRISRGEYAAAVRSLNDALVHSPGNPRFLYYQAVCYFYLKDEKKQCISLLKAREACPFLPTSMTDPQLGIMVECFHQ